MSAAVDTPHPVSRPKTAFLGLLGTIVGSFLPGFVWGAISAIVSGGDGKFDTGGLIAITAIILAVFTGITVATYLVGLLSLYFVARLRKASHAFWLAVGAGLLTNPIILSWQPWLVAGVHLAVFPILCMLYRQWSHATHEAAGHSPLTHS